jgi:3-hydroxybutyryl-CoA dehydratase
LIAKSVPLEVGDTFRFSKTVGESDVYLFAGITGDVARAHINDEYMKNGRYGQRIAHGVLSLGYASTVSTMVTEQIQDMPSVAYGYDRVRFVKPVLIGDTITVTYTIAEVDQASLKTYADIEITNQRGELCTVARHILKFFTD